ncbi:MAG: DUF6311 domain-containing protein, partial [Vicinamibacterales bacterium]
MTTRTPASARQPVAGVLGAAAFGAVFFTWIAGARILDPTAIEWLMKGDWVPHHFGWHFFRVEPWHWPPGTVQSYYAPLGTSIGLTDSIPLAAYVLKPFGPWLPAHVQYLGPWLLLSFVLQGALAARLIGRWVASPALQAAGGALCVLTPALLARVGHTALCSHWLLFWTLLLVTRPTPARTASGAWLALGLAAGLVQPYLAAMVLALAAAVAVRGSDPPIRRAIALACVLGATAVGWWLSGMFILGGGRAAFTEGGLGYYSMNLLAYVAPLGWSRVVPALPLAGPGQEAESFHYLGLGLLGLVAVAAGLTLAARWRRGASAAIRTWPPGVVAAALAMAVFALSPIVTFGPWVLVDAGGPWTAPLATFRSSGRFGWPLGYVMVVWAIVTVGRRLSPRAALAVLGIALAVQLADLHDAHLVRWRAARDPVFHDWPRLFASARWAAIAPRYRHVELVPAPQCGAAPIPYEPAVRLAAEHGLTVNAGVIARRDLGAQRRYCVEADAAIDAVRLRDDTLNDVSEPAAGVLERMGGPAVACGRIDTVWICTTAAAYAAWAGEAPFD